MLKFSFYKLKLILTTESIKQNSKGHGAEGIILASGLTTIFLRQSSRQPLSTTPPQISPKKQFRQAAFVHGLPVPIFACQMAIHPGCHSSQ